MKCEFQDGWKVDYSGALRINHGDDVNVYIKDGLIPPDFKSQLDQAEQSHSCEMLKKVAEDVTNKFGSHACIHED